MDAYIFDAWQRLVLKPVLDLNAEPTGAERFLDGKVGKAVRKTVKRTPT